MLGYGLAFAVESALGGSSLRAVGWRDPWLPLAVEGLAVGVLVGGWRGVVLAPLPFVLTPETVRWLQEAVVDLQRGERFLGFAALVYLVPLLVVAWVGGALGGLLGWLLWRRKQPRR